MVRSSGYGVIGVMQCFGDEPADVAAASRVDVPAPVATGDYESGQAQLGEVLAGGGRRGADQAGERPDIMAAMAQQPQQAKARRVRQ